MKEEIKQPNKIYVPKEWLSNLKVMQELKRVLPPNIEIIEK